MFPAFEKYRIDILSALILAALTLAAGISVYVVMQRQAESLLSQKIESLLQSNERLFQSEIEQSLTNTRAAARRPFVIRNLQLLASKLGNTSGLTDLQRIARSFLPTVFTGLSFYDVRGHEVVREGHFSQKHDLRVPLKSTIHAALLWDGQFILQASVEVIDQQGRRIGMVMTEAKLSSITEAFADIAAIGGTGEFLVCAPVADDGKKMDCFLSSISGKVFKRFPRVVEGKPLPMNYALNGETGIIFAGDYRREQVAAAYTLVGPLGLGMVMKIDQAELHQPVLEQLKFIALVLAALMLSGVLLLHVLVRPMVRKLIDSERATRAANTLLRESEQRLRTIIETEPECVKVVSPQGRLLEMNAAGLAMLEADSLGEAQNGLLMDFILPEYHDAFRALHSRVMRGERETLEFEVRGLRGTRRRLETHAAPMRDAANEVVGMLAITRDISARKQAEEQISFLAFHDALTRLPNRLLAKDHLQQAILAAKHENAKVALLFIDLDNFKTINDSLGHVIGDGLLQGVAVRLRECLRDTDTLSRQGGDEFLIVLNSVCDTESVTMVVEKILERIAEPFEIDQHELSISLSIGIAVYPDDGKDFDTLLKQSDTAMYQAKDSGRNTYRFHTEQMNIDAVEHLRMRSGLRRALERGEFVLHYQPQISLASGAVIGAEALIRWNHPELGLVAPGRFISVAEDTGLIVPMGEWVLREACRQSVAWRKAGLPELVMAVNLSAVQFKRGDVLKSVTQALAESGLEPALLELELTESILIKDTEKVLATVRQLKSLGVKLSIDDFGTGYSSLSYLKQFDVDKLKIDQSFVRDMVDDPNDAAIVRAIIQMAKGLNLTTIAEGVEDECQLALLRLQHCDEVQGYHFARPMPADQFESFMSRFMASAAK